MHRHLIIDMITLYILSLKNGKFYIGITKDLDNRMREHKYKVGSTIIHTESFDDYKDARVKEKYYKKLGRVRLLKQLHLMKI